MRYKTTKHLVLEKIIEMIKDPKKDDPLSILLCIFACVITLGVLSSIWDYIVSLYV